MILCKLPVWRLFLSGFVCGLLSVASAAQVRNDDGTPGPDYWQQWVDYDIEVELNPANHVLSGTGRMRYHNESPVALPVIWLQLDQNRFRPGSLSLQKGKTVEQATLDYLREADPGIRNLRVRDQDGRTLQVELQDTYARVELAEALASGASIELQLEWQLNLLDRSLVKARSGYEQLPGGEAIHLAAQWFPRAAVFHDDGWHLDPFLGQGEFSLEFGNYRVAITVPADHVVAATGELLNADSVLAKEEHRRLLSARAGHPEVVSTPGREGQGRRRWEFRAEGVRDFTFATSASFYWQASAVTLGEHRVLTQVFYPRAGQHLWGRYGLDAIAHTLREFSARLFPYPWPVASMVNIAGLGMEYPMLGTNAERGMGENARWDMIGGVIHEVGHNWFPMSVNSNERRYAWLDEGLVSFVEYHVEKSWDEDFLIIYGEPENLERYRGKAYQQPLMTPADELTHRIDNAYDYAAAALNILRRDVLGPQLFDRAFAHYANSWKFKRATAEDFFRAMEAGSGRDLSAFWEEWFYSVQRDCESRVHEGCR
ncbi:M1 family metallopeptidase [Pseudohalioglobus sediminis]|uniref:M1 family metallopeptidase n=1 Tax=Pseudohalioglobus sediminis TaxID=2606449 RepID=A0A5B0X521_9GAMM|nr:M1 family metallopeptidase [Pseudohalioglobus sediminis]KAA1194333.1 M1 family metallopeptidase [Pseudohalioglobus sediminis]